LKQHFKQQHIIRLLLLVITVVTVGYAAKRWDTWFQNRPEKTYSTSGGIERVLLSIGKNETSRAITWRCDTLLQESHVYLSQEPSGYTLRYSATGEIIATEGGKTAYYRCLIDSLKPGITYSYTITTGNQVSERQLFRIPDKKDGSFSFVYLGDIQDTINGLSRKIFPSVAQRCPEADFWLFGGDVIERYLEEYWAEWFAAIDTIARQMPILAVSGNHEQYKGYPKRLDPRFTAHHYYPANGIDSTSRHGNYRIYGNALIVSLTTYELPAINVAYKQYFWLKRLLKNSDCKWKIVVMHHPVYSPRAGRFNIFSRLLFNPLFKKYNVDLVLQGHDHAYARRGQKSSENTLAPLYIVSSCSPKKYAPAPNGNFDRMAAGVNFYQQINVVGDTLALAAYETGTHLLYDSVLVIKKAGYTAIESHINRPEIWDVDAVMKNKSEKKQAAYREKVEKRLKLGN